LVLAPGCDLGTALNSLLEGERCGVEAAAGLYLRSSFIIAVLSIPSLMAIASAVLKPMPRMSSARTGSVMTWNQ
jgi:hypothetical protein